MGAVYLSRGYVTCVTRRRPQQFARTERTDPCDLVLALGWVVEMHHVLRGNGHPITHGGAEVPSLQDRQDLLLDAVADALKQSGLDDIALSVDCDLDNYIPFDASRQIGARHRRIGENFRQCRHNFVAGHRRTRYSPPRRTTARGLLGRILL